MAQTSTFESSAQGPSTQNSPNPAAKSVENFWKTAQKSGKVYAEYDKVGILQNPPGSEPQFENLIPNHLDKDHVRPDGKKDKQVWHSPQGITYYLYEGDDSQWDDEQKKYVPKIGADGKALKKWLAYRVPTAEYKPFTPSFVSNSGNKQQFEIYATNVVEIGEGHDIEEHKKQGWKVPQNPAISSAFDLNTNTIRHFTVLVKRRPVEHAN